MTKHPLTLTQYIDGKAGHGTGKEHEITNPFDNSSICNLKQHLKMKLILLLKMLMQHLRAQSGKKCLAESEVNF